MNYFIIYYILLCIPLSSCTSPPESVSHLQAVPVRQEIMIHLCLGTVPRNTLNSRLVQMGYYVTAVVGKWCARKKNASAQSQLSAVDVQLKTLHLSKQVFFLFYCYSYYLFGFYYFLALFFICARSSIPDDNVTKKIHLRNASIDNLSKVSNSSSRTGKILKSNSVRLRNKRSFPSPY